MQGEFTVDHRRAGRVVASLTARRAARSGALWGLVFGIYTLSSITNFTTIAKTPVQRSKLARSLGTNAGLHALFGVARRIDTGGSPPGGASELPIHDVHVRAGLSTRWTTFSTLPEAPRGRCRSGRTDTSL